jgi:D-glycero-D-manno-heptose 1,7-bisphosphate phosphatase
VGDSARDLAAATAVGARAILVLTGNGKQTLADGIDEGIEVYPDLAHAAEELIRERQQ